jgi:hypothetical protein
LAIIHCRARPGNVEYEMDRKSRKHLEVLRQRQQQLQRQLAGAREQADDPHEVAQIEAELKKVAEAIEKLKTG